MWTSACDELVKPVVVNPTTCPCDPSVCIDATVAQSVRSAKKRTGYLPVVL